LTESPLPSSLPAASGEPAWVTRLARTNPQAPFIAPFMVFLLIMAAERLIDPSWRTYTYAFRSVASVYTAWLFRRYYPPLGQWHLHIAIPVGVLVAFGWVEIHHWFAGCTHQPCRMLGLFGISHHFEGVDWYRNYATQDGKVSEYFIPSDHYHSKLGLWAFLIVRIGGASTAVPIIEEIFWRAFVLRILIDWHRFEDVPYAKFTWASFLGCSLLSAVSHLPQWEVGILCWFAYNGLYYWKKSLALCMITHGITNFTLYVYVYYAQDWRFW
jgi:membrane protease YdiL (CAAX protease family)